MKLAGQERKTLLGHIFTLLVDQGKKKHNQLRKFLSFSGSEIFQIAIDFLVEEKCFVCGKELPFNPGSFAKSRDASSNVLSQYVCVKVGIFKIRNRTLCARCSLSFDRAEKPGVLGYLSGHCRVDTVNNECFLNDSIIDFKNGIVCEEGAFADSSTPLLVVAPWMTNDSVLSIVHLVKYRAIRSLSQFVADSIFDAFARFKAELPQGDLLVPVPSHGEDLLKRGFNHADLIAEELSTRIGIPVSRDILKKIKRTKRQSQTPSNMRAENIRNAFLSTSLRGENVFLVDDLVTTGSTAASCASSLLHAGAGGVLVLCFGRAL